ncbi:MAG: DeoR/GlpR family DNA-binding transcription regulator [Bacillota bacterium]
MNASARERRERILAELFEKRHVTAKDLAVAMAVSEATVRRDLKALADSGQLELVYGGAALRRPADYSFHSKGTRNVEAKRAIGQLAAGLVGDNEQIFIDSGTTCFEMVPFLKRRRNLSVIVNSARLTLELDAPGVSVLMLGGQYRPDRMDAVGPLATATLDQLRGYLCFIGADGLGMDFGLAAADIESANLYRLAAHNARETVLLADHTKFFTLSLFKIVEWDLISRLVTDKEPSQEWCEFLNAKGIQVIHPMVEPTENSPEELAKMKE